MKLKLVYFGRIAEITKVSGEIIEKNESCTVQQLLDELTLRYPLFNAESFQIAVHHNVVNSTFCLDEDAEIAILPPFAGG